MDTNTTQYEFSHGKKPQGYGAWGLTVTGTDGRGAYTTERYFITGKLGDVKKQAAKRLKSECGAVKAIIGITVEP